MRVLFGSVLGLWVVAACGSGAASQKKASPPPPQIRPGVPPPSDEAGLRKLLAGEVANGGLWFADSTCQAQFGQAAMVGPDAFDAFANCVAGLHLHPTGRPASLDDVSVLTDDAGFEIVARIVGGRLELIGFSGRADGAPELPTITPATLESLRISGDRDATLSADDARRALVAGSLDPTDTQHLRLCIAEDGHLSTVMPATTTTYPSAKAFAAVAYTWTFRPFVVDGKPIAVCSIVGFQYPATPPDANRDRLPRPPRISKAGNVFYIVNPVDLEKLRVAGTKLIAPDDEDKTYLQGKRLVGSFKVCLDETGHYEEGFVLQSTGLASYDAKLARTMMQWVYQPYVVDGVAIPVCSAVTFIYTQR